MAVAPPRGALAGDDQGAPTSALADFRYCEMKEALLLGDVQGFGTLIRQGWEAKARVADKITNNAIDETIDAAIAAGALGGKVSGAGGGGFIMLFVEPEKKASVHSALAQMNGRVFHFNFTETGAFAWPASELSSFAVR